MKFGKEFKRQMVPEWMEAYMDYQGLKKILGKILRHKPTRQHSAALSSLQHKLSLGRTFTEVNLNNSHKVEGDIEEQTIEVNTVEHNGSRKIYQTDFLRESDEGGEIEVTFFRKLDAELNKVNNFFKDKVKDMMEEVTELNKQMNALVALRIKVRNPDSCSKDNSPNKAANASRRSNSGTGIEESNINVDKSVNDDCENSSSSSEHDEELQHTKCGTTFQREDSGDDEEDGLKILDRVTLNNTLETPLSTLKCVLRDSKDEELHFKKDELRKVERRLQHVLIVFYQKLCLLKHYSYMNLAAFSKIMKKYDKISSRRVSRSYMRVVDNSCIGNPDEVINLIENVEATFTKHFANSNRRAAMKSLRPKAKKENNTVTFFSGFFSGCTVALVVAIVLKIQARKLMEKPEGTSYMVNIFPLYSLFGYIVLHMLMYTTNIYFWRRYRVNYTFIFGFKQGTELGHREVFLLSVGLLVLALSGFLVNLYLNLGARRFYYKTVTELVPLVLITVALVILFCPFNIIYRSSRFFFIRTLFRCICAPLYKVRLPDFFLADHLTSQIQAIRCVELYICYYGLGEFSMRQNKCHNHGTYTVFHFIIAAVPFWLRFLQCFRRFCEDRDSMHAYNALKYSLTIIAVSFRTAYELRRGKKWMVLALASSAFATVMAIYWDIVVDWGLLRRKSKNPFLRDKLVVSRRSIYFAAMVLNVVLRLAWLQLLFQFNLPSLHKLASSTAVASLEIIRRGIWSFFRLENEHLNNVGKYRAFKSVPLPFNYDHSDSDKED